MKVSSEDAIPINATIMEGVKEIEPWGMYEQTAWHYAKAMVEEEVRVGRMLNHCIGASKTTTKIGCEEGYAEEFVL